jgi:acetyltransferase-like isoleucine patch superfamily enzyme
MSHVTDECRIWNSYGPAETTISCTLYLLDRNDILDDIPLDKPIVNYHCMIKDEFLENVIMNQEGELYVGGIGVFAGYLGRDDLTEKALIEIDGETFYRTGDLVRMDENGILHYQGRKDHQVKLHGQRIELGEIERCLLDTSISVCVVVKWGDDHLVAYVQNSDMNEKELREHCQNHLPPHMVPSIFMVLEKLPLNANGKIDRKSLPTPQFQILSEADETDLSPLTALEEHLRRIFSEIFHNESPNVTMSFGQMGGTSLDAIRAIWRIRQEVYDKMDAALLFANPSIRELAHAIQPFLAVNNDLPIAFVPSRLEDDENELNPSLFIELVGIFLLISQWLIPIWSVFHFDSVIILIFMPVLHLLSYVVCQRLMIHSEEIGSKRDKLYSWNYYKWWFLNSMWWTNNSCWLKHLVGTPFYNCYLRWCGAKVGRHSHIYTTLIDTPWLIEVGESTFIGEEVVISSLSYQNQVYELHRIQIGSHCSINIRSVLYNSVVIDDHVYVEPMSSIIGHLTASKNKISMIDRSLSFSHTIYQMICLFCLLVIHIMLIFVVHLIYHNYLTLFLPLSVSLALIWLIWVLMSLFIVILILKFIVGFVTPGHYSLNSYYYLHKLWLRQLIITSFHHSLNFVPLYDVLPSIIFRWLGAHIEDDVKFAEFEQILRFPSNLLHIKYGATTFGGALLVSFEMTKEGPCYLDEIHLGSGVNLTNWCTIMPGTRISSGIIVGSLTLVTRIISSHRVNGVLLGIPACEMPFAIPENTSIVNGIPSSTSSFIRRWSLICLSFFISKCFLITLYTSLPLIIALLIHLIVICAFYRYSILTRRKTTNLRFSEVITHFQRFLRTLISDLFIFFGSYLSGTQFLVLLFRALGAQIGSDVIISDVGCLADPHLVSIGNHVRLARNAHIQVKHISIQFLCIDCFSFIFSVTHSSNAYSN